MIVAQRLPSMPGSFFPRVPRALKDRMNRPHLFIVAASLALAHAAAVAAPSAPAIDATNPFAQPSSLPLNYPAFDKIRNEHFLPAYTAGMAEHLREIDAIARDKAAPTFENTIVAMERAGQMLSLSLIHI